MKEPVHIKDKSTLNQVLAKYGMVINTEMGNTYINLPHWFQISEDGTSLLVDWPEDLSMFIVKEGLGGDNLRRIKTSL